MRQAGLTQSKSLGVAGGTSSHGGVHGGVAVTCDRNRTSTDNSTSTDVAIATAAFPPALDSSAGSGRRGGQRREVHRRAWHIFIRRYDAICLQVHL